jgi:hypothetical protein
VVSGKLVELIEGSWQEIAKRLIFRVRSAEETQTLASQSDAELRAWCREIVENLSYWLSGGKQEEVRRRYQVLGRVRFEESIPLHEAVMRFHMLKNVIVEFIHERGLPITSMDLYAEEELELRAGRFFDCLVYHLVMGYENAMRAPARGA